MALPQVQSYRASVANVPSAATPNVTFGQQTRADLAVQAQAQYQNTVGDVLDRLSSKMFGVAEKESAREGEQFAIENPLTTEQLDAMVNGRMPEDLDLGNPRNVFDAAVRKHRAMEVAGHADIEVRAKATELLQKAEDGSVDTEGALSQLNGAIDGYAKILAKNVDPDASYKFRASASKYGSQIITEIAKIESRKRRVANQTKVDRSYDDFLVSVRLAAQGELPINQDTQQPWDLNDYLDKEKQRFLADADRLGGPEVFNTFAQKIDNDIRAAKIAVITNGVVDKDPEIGGDAFEAVSRLRKGRAGKFQTVYNSMSLTDQASMRKKIHEAFTEIVELNKADQAAAKMQAEPEFRGLQAAYFKKPTPQLLDQMRALALRTGVVSVEYVEDMPNKVASMEVKNPRAEMRLRDEVKKGLIPDLQAFLQRGGELGIGDNRLNELYSYKESYQTGVDSRLVANARRAARIVPGASRSTARQDEAYYKFEKAVNDTYNDRMLVWEDSGRKGIPPNKDSIADELFNKQRGDTRNEKITQIYKNLFDNYGVEGAMRKSTINFKEFVNYLVYDEATNEVMGISEEGKIQLRRFEFSSAEIQDIQDNLRAIDDLQRELNEIRLEQ